MGKYFPANRAKRGKTCPNPHFLLTNYTTFWPKNQIDFKIYSNTKCIINYFIIDYRK